MRSWSELSENGQKPSRGNLIRGVRPAGTHWISAETAPAKGTRCDYGKLTIDAGKTITEEPIDNPGPTFTLEVPRDGVTAIVIPKAQ